jgi:hypothetical protein
MSFEDTESEKVPIEGVCVEDASFYSDEVAHRSVKLHRRALLICGQAFKHL